MSLPTIPYDKALHFVYGVLISVAASVFSMHSGLPAAVAAFSAALAFGVMKEAYDWITGRGTLDALDVLATVAGSVPIAILAQLPGLTRLTW